MGLTPRKVHFGLQLKLKYLASYNIVTDGSNQFCKFALAKIIGKENQENLYSAWRVYNLFIEWIYIPLPNQFQKQLTNIKEIQCNRQ